MRIICTLNNVKDGHTFSNFLKSEGIENQLEIVQNNDWGSSDYGTQQCNIWVTDEDSCDKAIQWADKYTQNPDDPIFHKTQPTITPTIMPTAPGPHSMAAATETKKPNGALTMYMAFLCIALFLISEFTTPAFFKPAPSIPYTPLFTAPIKKRMLFDYPYAYELIDKVVSAYGLEKMRDLKQIPDEGRVLIEQYTHTPYWQGIYPKLLAYAQGLHPSWELNAPLFEKEHEGELWRLWTPIFLHSDFFHLFFNIIWLVVLGRQMEDRLGKLRYILFIAITALFSNTLQYFMSGANFIGFSGVLCAMFTYIYVRQKKAAWEGYQLQSATIGFIAFFIVAMLAIQVLSFFTESFAGRTISPGIANTAHLSGAFLGYVFGQLGYFSMRSEY